MRESVKEFCRINGINDVTADALFDAYIGSEANDNSRDGRNNGVYNKPLLVCFLL